MLVLSIEQQILSENRLFSLTGINPSLNPHHEKQYHENKKLPPWPYAPKEPLRRDKTNIDSSLIEIAYVLLQVYIPYLGIAQASLDSRI
jgi:hypothetical protein